MVFYQCQRCGYKTCHKNDFRKHVNKKNPCGLEIDKIDSIHNLCDQKSNFPVEKMNKNDKVGKKIPQKKPKKKKKKK